MFSREDRQAAPREREFGHARTRRRFLRLSMIRSMTGYSIAAAEETDFSLSVGIRSTNHRFLDLRVALPAGLEALEPGLRQQLKGEVARGHLEVEVSLKAGRAAELPIDRVKLEAYLRTCLQLSGE